MFGARTVAVVAVAAAVALASCGGTEAPRSGSSATSDREPPSPASPSPSPAPADPPSPSPSLEPAIRLPDDAPTSFDDDLGPGALPLDALIPPDAAVTASHAQPATDGGRDTVALAWARGEDPFVAERGLVVWQRFDDRPSWRVVYAFTDPPSRGVLGIRVEPGDVTDDGVDDLLSFEDTGGSGACGTWRVVVNGDGASAEVWRRRGCDTQVRLVRAGVEVREAVFEPGDAHCCPSAYRLTRLAWDGRALTEVRSTVSPAAG